MASRSARRCCAGSIERGRCTVTFPIGRTRTTWTDWKSATANSSCRQKANSNSRLWWLPCRLPDFGITGDTPAGAVLLHDLARENVELTVLVLADLGDFVGALFVASHDRALRGRGVSGGKFDDDARVWARAEMQDFVG